jgi:L-2-hydroxyglutarate oxidase LhgO
MAGAVPDQRAVTNGTKDVVVVGGGLIGLATAMTLLERHPGLRLAVVEKEQFHTAHQSGRNSGVIHAGLYYAPGSLKAQLCREGRELLIAFAEEHGIDYTLLGKLVVAVDETELDRLDELRRRGEANGLTGLRYLDRDGLREVEPHVEGFRALHVPESGIIDYRRVAEAYAARIRTLGGEVVVGASVSAISPRRDHVEVSWPSGSVRTGFVVTCGGVQSDRLAALTGSESSEYRIVPFRGDYFTFAPRARSLVRGLVYPVPDPSFPFLGVHFTPRMDGEVWAGPNAVPSFAREGYRRIAFNARDTWDVVSFRGFGRLAMRYARMGALEIWRDVDKRAAVRTMRRYLPELKLEDVRFGPCGIRAQCMKNDGTLVDDFLFAEADRTLHLLNAPSPGATASLAIGRMLADRAAAQADLAA